MGSHSQPGVPAPVQTPAGDLRCFTPSFPWEKLIKSLPFDSSQRNSSGQCIILPENSSYPVAPVGLSWGADDKLHCPPPPLRMGALTAWAGEALSWSPAWPAKQEKLQLCLRLKPEKVWR